MIQELGWINFSIVTCNQVNSGHGTGKPLFVFQTVIEWKNPQDVGVWQSDRHSAWNHAGYDENRSFLSVLSASELVGWVSSVWRVTLQSRVGG